MNRNIGEFKGWDDAQLGRLRELWNEGVSTSKIGQALGRTKNSIVGKAHRLGLEPRNSPIKPRRVGLKPTLRRATGATLPVLASSAAPRTKPVPGALASLPSLSHADLTPLGASPAGYGVRSGTYLPARPSNGLYGPLTRSSPADENRARLPDALANCCWPIGDPRRAGFRFCDAVLTAADARNYCAEHYARSVERTTGAANQWR